MIVPDVGLAKRSTTSTAAPERAAGSLSRNVGLAILAAGGLFAASTHEAAAQLCTCAEPGWMNCSLMGFFSHEPATAAFPECMARGSYRGAEEPAASDDNGEAPLANDNARQEFRGASGRRARPHVRRGAVMRPPPPRAPAVQPQPIANPPVAAPPIAPAVAAPTDALASLDFDPKNSFQIRPLNCPRGFVAVGQTFYGGTRCGWIAPPPPAGGVPAPVASAVAAVAAALDNADDASASDDNPTAGTGASPAKPPSPASEQDSPPAPPTASPMSPLPEPPPPSQAAAANALNQDMAKSNWAATWPIAASAGLVVGVPVGVAAFAIRRYGLTLIPW